MRFERFYPDLAELAHDLLMIEHCPDIVADGPSAIELDGVIGNFQAIQYRLMQERLLAGVVARELRDLVKQIRAVPDQAESKQEIANQFEAVIMVLDHTLQGEDPARVLARDDVKEEVIKKSGIGAFISMQEAARSGEHAPGMSAGAARSLGLSDLIQKSDLAKIAPRPSISSKPAQLIAEQAQRDQVSPASLQLDL